MVAVRIVSRRTVRPSHGAMPMPSEDIQLTSWDINAIRIGYNHKGIFLPKPPAGGEMLIDTLASSLARALGRYYHFAGRLAVEEHGDDTVTISLRCTGEGAELVHVAAPGVAIADIVGSVYTPSSLISAFFPLRVNGLVGADAAIDSSIPLFSATVTELADGVFIGMSMNHIVGDGTSFWELFNAWSAINRGGDQLLGPPPVLLHQRWFVNTSPVPIHLPSSMLQDVVRRIKSPPAREGFFTFSAASVKKLKMRANDEMACSGISSLQALLAHLWRAVSRARRLPPGQETIFILLIGLRGRIRSIPSAGYVGNAITRGVTGCTVGEILDKGLGWTAWQLNRAVASFDEAAMREKLDGWVRKPTFVSSLTGCGTRMLTSSSPRFDVFGNDFGWGKPVAVRSGPVDKMDGLVTVFEGPERGGSISLEVRLPPKVLERLIADHEFIMDATP